MHKIRTCPACKKYTMLKECPACKGATNIAKPQKYSPEDRYGDYRRKAKAQLAAPAQPDDNDD